MKVLRRKYNGDYKHTVEPVGDFNINMTTVVDFCQWKHKLPKEQL